MSFVLLHADRLATTLVDDPLVAKGDVPAVHSVASLLAEAGRLHEAARADLEGERAAARQAGFEQGRRDGHAAGAAENREELLRLAAQDVEERRRRQREIAALALEVVRRIAGRLGDDAVVASLAEQAAAEIAPDTAATVRVAPAVLEATRARLADRAGLVVEPDPTLSPTDCVIETALGKTVAGLDTQLSHIEVAWRGMAADGR